MIKITLFCNLTAILIIIIANSVAPRKWTSRHWRQDFHGFLLSAPWRHFQLWWWRGGSDPKQQTVGGFILSPTLEVENYTKWKETIGRNHFFTEPWWWEGYSNYLGNNMEKPIWIHMKVSRGSKPPTVTRSKNRFLSCKNGVRSSKSQSQIRSIPKF